MTHRNVSSNFETTVSLQASASATSGTRSPRIWCFNPGHLGICATPNGSKYPYVGVFGPFGPIFYRGPNAMIFGYLDPMGKESGVFWFYFIFGESFGFISSLCYRSVARFVAPPLRVQVPNYKVSTQNHNYDF